MISPVSSHKLTLYKFILHNGWELYVVAPTITEAEKAFKAYQEKVPVILELLAIHVIAAPNVKTDLLIAEGVLHG